MNARILCTVVLLFLFAWAPAVMAVPPVTGTPMIDSPLLLAWPQDTDLGTPDLTEQTANRAFDLHGNFSNCDLVLSTAGNYHMALGEFWYTVFLPKYTGDLGLKNWFFTTSPPISKEQIQNQNLVLGNFALRCGPQLVVGPAASISDLKNAGLTEGAQIPLFHNRGNVLLVKRGNPMHIKTIWDLGRPNVRVVTPNRDTERNTFDNYSGSIYNIALNDEANAPAGWTADRLFDAIFNNPVMSDKWLAGKRIHHREVPWSIAYGRGDVAVIFYHLALDAVRTFPGLFEIIPLGGTEDNPQPVKGNQVGAHFIIRIKGSWTPEQITARERLIDALGSQDFTDILEKHGLQR